MRQQDDEVYSIWYQVESLQEQFSLVPMEIETIPFTSGASPPVEQPLLDLNMPTQDIEQEEWDHPNHFSLGN